jgi:hypothetical protein
MQRPAWTRTSWRCRSNPFSANHSPGRANAKRRFAAEAARQKPKSDISWGKRGHVGDARPATSVEIQAAIPARFRPDR